MMKSPSDWRPVWLGGVLQINITRACDLSCTNCTQGSQLAGKPMMMTVDQFEQAVSTLIDYPGVVGIFGGNPCVHPRFVDICRVLERYISKERRGLWSNNLRGHGKLCREIFNPEFSNLNVHCDLSAYNEMKRDWPECQPKGLQDSRHSPPYVAMKDLKDLDKNEMWRLINDCDINKFWSAMIGVFRGELRAWFCEIAGAQSMLHENELDYPDTGLEVKDDWWIKPLDDFISQVNYHCPSCGIPLRGYGDLGVNGRTEQVSATHLNIYKLKHKGQREIELVSSLSQLGSRLQVATNYIENGILA